MTKRLLALATAAAMVAAALWIRERGNDDDGNGRGDDGRQLVVACITELADACEELEADIIVQDAAETVAALSAREVEFDAWVTIDPWPEIANIDADRAALEAPSEPVASTGLQVAVVTRSLTDCAGTSPWRCLADAGSAAALPPTETALGLLLLGNAASDFLGTTEFFRDAFDEPDFDRWFRGLEFVDDPLGRLVRELPAAFVDAVGTTRAAFFDQVSGTRAADLLSALQPDPGATVAVVVVPVRGNDSSVDVGPLRDALVDRGWDADPAAASSNLPSPGVLLALLQR